MCPFCTGLQEERPGRVRIPYFRPHGRWVVGDTEENPLPGKIPFSHLGSGGYIGQNQRKENFVAPWLFVDVVEKNRNWRNGSYNLGHSALALIIND